MLTGLLLLAPVKKAKKMIHYDPWNGPQAHSGDRTPSESPARTQTHEPYPTSNPRRIFGDISPNRYVIGHLRIVA